MAPSRRSKEHAIAIAARQVTIRGDSHAGYIVAGVDGALWCATYTSARRLAARWRAQLVLRMLGHDAESAIPALELAQARGVLEIAELVDAVTHQ